MTVSNNVVAILAIQLNLTLIYASNFRPYILFPKGFATGSFYNIIKK